MDACGNAQSPIRTTLKKSVAQNVTFHLFVLLGLLACRSVENQESAFCTQMCARVAFI